MKLVALIIIVFLLTSCKTQHSKELLKGNYSSSGYTSEYNLILNDNNTFMYSIGFNNSLIAECNGIWMNNQDSLILKCKDESFLDGMSNTYMKNRLNNFKILNKGKKLKQGKVILTKR